MKYMATINWHQQDQFYISSHFYLHGRVAYFHIYILNLSGNNIKMHFFVFQLPVPSCFPSTVLRKDALHRKSKTKATSEHSVHNATSYTPMAQYQAKDGCKDSQGREKLKEF